MLKTKKSPVSRTGTLKTEKTAAVSRKKRSAAKTATRKKVAVRKKVSKKRVTAASMTPASPKSRVRKGRPLSIEVLQHKLGAAMTALKSEKKKRQQLAKDAKQTVRTAVIEKRKLKKQLTELKQNLSTLQNEKKSAEKQAVRQQKLDIARNQAVGKFLERWERDQQKKNAAPAVKVKRRKKVRRAAS